LSDNSDVIKRKIASALEVSQEFSLKGLMSTGVERAAGKGGGNSLGITVEGLTEETTVAPLTDILDDLPMPGMQGIIENEEGDLGLFSLDMELVTTLVEELTGDDSATNYSMAVRSLTKIDVSLCTIFIDAVMAALDEIVKTLTESEGLGKFQLTSHEQMPMPLAHILPNQPYIIFKVSLDIGMEARTGTFTLAVPFRLFLLIEKQHQSGMATKANEDDEVWQSHMHEVVQSTPLDLTCVALRQKMSLKNVLDMKPGDMISLPGVSIKDLGLELNLASGPSVFARGELGTFRGCRAFRLTSDPMLGELPRLEIQQ
jgi:flagellar motor switch protein FliM